MRYFKKIVGDRIYLSPINIDDAERYTEWINDLEVAINLSSAHKIYSLEEEREVLARLNKDGYNFAIVEQENDLLLGNCGLMAVDLVDRKAELGLFIGDKKYWNQGYGREAIRLLLDYGFNLLNLHNIMLLVHSFNRRALKCYQKCGFKLIGRRRESIIIGDKAYDEIYMDILAQEFQGEITNLIKD